MEPPAALMIWTITWVVFLASWTNSQTVCPSVCACKWKSGKQTAECAGKGLTVIPAGLNTATQVIDLSRNNLQEISSLVFHEKGLVNLQKIFLVECGISQISHNAFFQLSNLVELDLTGNLLSEVPTEALKDCSLLRRLQLAQNPIKQINEGAFTSLTSLTFLDLSNCQIETLKQRAFSGLNSLEILKLDGNKLRMLSVSVVEPLPKLYGLHLQNNPWLCDCNLRGIREWMIDHNIPLLFPPHCHNPPQVRETTWKMMTLEDFACAPNVNSPLSRDVEVVAGHNATLNCQIKAIPQAAIYWEIGGRFVLNISSISEHKGKYSVEEDGEDLQSSRLTIINVGETDSDIFVCVAENKAGNASVNFTLTVVLPNPPNGSWSNAQITFVLIGVFLAVAIVVAIICVLIFHPVALTSGTKVTGVNVLKHITSKKQDAAEVNDGGSDKEEKEFKTTDKHPRHETGSSGYGSDQLTPDLVSKIVDMNNGPSLSTSTVSCNHPDPDSVMMSEGYGPMGEQWSLSKSRPPRYEESPGRSLYTEVYPNPCYGKDEDRDCCIAQSPGMQQLPDYHVERYIPQNDRVRTLRGGSECSASSPALEGVRDDLYVNPAHNGTWKRSPIVVSNNISHYTLPAKARFSPDEGYAEEALEGTEV